jgi:hypothetical protein
MLSKMVLQQVIVPLDGVKPGEEDGPRSRRQDVVRGVQRVLGRMDYIDCLHR